MVQLGGEATKHTQPEQKAAEKDAVEEKQEGTERDDLQPHIKEPKQDMKGFTPGRSPYKAHEGPTANACEEVYRLLAEHHKDRAGDFIQKENIARASLEMAGCGEVKHVIDALLRTVLSGSTTMENANRALQSLHKTYGSIFEDTEQESVNWDAVRRRSRAELERAIHCGGLGPKKSRHIKDILDTVYEEGLARCYTRVRGSDTTGNTAGNHSIRTTSDNDTIRDASSDATDNDAIRDNDNVDNIRYSGSAIGTSGSNATNNDTIRDDSIGTTGLDTTSDIATGSDINAIQGSMAQTDKVAMEILSLDHLREVSKTDAIKALLKFHGIGVKTAACVSLFCLRKECFAVDTHVHRFCGWLGWVPKSATANGTFNHCELHVPDHLKYGLHQLFIIHGKTCYRCKASTKAGSKEWNKWQCPLEKLLDRGDEKMRRGTGQGGISRFLRGKAATNGESDEGETLIDGGKELPNTSGDGNPQPGVGEERAVDSEPIDRKAVEAEETPLNSVPIANGHYEGDNGDVDMDNKGDAELGSGGDIRNDGDVKVHNDIEMCDDSDIRNGGEVHKDGEINTDMDNRAEHK